MSSVFSEDSESLCSFDFSDRESVSSQSEVESVIDDEDDDATLTDCSCCNDEDLVIDWDSLYIGGFITVEKYMEGIFNAAGIAVTEDMEQDGDAFLETEEDFKTNLTNLLRQMMFVSGETAEPSPETTTLIEEIVRQQVVEIVCSSVLPPYIAAC